MSYVDCGLGCAKDAATCAKITIDMILSVILGIGKLAMNFLAPGLGAGVEELIKMGIDMAKAAKNFNDLISGMLIKR